MGPWDMIINKDILLQKSRHLGACLDINKTKSYIQRIQAGGGYFEKPSPGIETTRFCTGILHSLGEKPAEKTINYIKSLQVGTYGLAQTTGEMPWVDKSYLALQMFNWFNLKVQEKAGLINFFKNFQNEDGGFGSIIQSESDPQTTMLTLQILSILDSEPDNRLAAIEYLKKMNCSSLREHYHRVVCLQSLGISRNEDISRILERYSAGDLDIKDRYYYYAIKKHFGLQAECELQKLFDAPEENYYLARLARLANYHKLDQELIRYAHALELPQGGYPWRPQGIISNGFMIQSLLLMGGLQEIDSESFKNWLLSVKNMDGWGSRPGDSEYHEYTVAALIALRLLETDTDKTFIVQKAMSDMENALEFPGNNNYFVLRTVKNSLEKLMLCGISPPLYKIPKKIMKYFLGGGFGSNIPYLYATYWAVRALYLCENYMELSGKIFISRIRKIRNPASSWINSCQNNDGGYGPGPGQPSNIQSTYCAIYSLWMLKSKPNNVKKAVAWIKSLQADDGGFAGLPGMDSEMLHILYAVGSLAILAEMDACNKY